METPPPPRNPATPPERLATRAPTRRTLQSPERSSRCPAAAAAAQRSPMRIGPSGCCAALR